MQSWRGVDNDSSYVVLLHLGDVILGAAEVSVGDCPYNLESKLSFIVNIL